MGRGKRKYDVEDAEPISVSDNLITYAQFKRLCSSIGKGPLISEQDFKMVVRATESRFQTSGWGVDDGERINAIFDQINQTKLEYVEITTRLELLPSDKISCLNHVIILDISNSSLTSLPEEISTLKNLKRLILKMNRLTSLPDRIGELKQLEILNVEHNRITDLPSSLFQLENLHTLILFHNLLTELPDEIGNLTNLVHLDIETNHIKKLPKSVKNLTKLTYTPLELQIKKKKVGDLPGRKGKKNKSYDSDELINEEENEELIEENETQDDENNESFDDENEEINESLDDNDNVKGSYDHNKVMSDLLSNIDLCESEFLKNKEEKMEKKNKSKSLKQIVSKKRKTKKISENSFQLENESKVEVNDIVKPIKTLVIRKPSIDMTDYFPKVIEINDSPSDIIKKAKELEDNTTFNSFGGSWFM